MSFDTTTATKTTRNHLHGDLETSATMRATTTMPTRSRERQQQQDLTSEESLETSMSFGRPKLWLISLTWDWLTQFQLKSFKRNWFDWLKLMLTDEEFPCLTSLLPLNVSLPPSTLMSMSSGSKSWKKTDQIDQITRLLPTWMSTSTENCPLRSCMEED